MATWLFEYITKSGGPIKNMCLEEAVIRSEKFKLDCDLRCRSGVSRCLLTEHFRFVEILSLRIIEIIARNIISIIALAFYWLW